MLYLTLVRLIHSYKFLAEPGTDGPNIDPISGSSRHSALASPPDPFKVLFRPRDQVHLVNFLGEKPLEFGGLASE